MRESSRGVKQMPNRVSTESHPLPSVRTQTSPESRFSFPTGVSADSIGNVLVADTYNHLISHVATNGTVRTLAGTLVLAETDSNGNALPGCPAPCLKGVKGFADGSLTTARFFFPADVAIDMGSGTVTVADHNRIRRISLPSWVYAGTGISTTQTVQSRNRVVTIAGNTTNGHADGIGQHVSICVLYFAARTPQIVSHSHRITKTHCRPHFIPPKA